MSDSPYVDPPSAFIARWIEELAALGPMGRRVRGHPPQRALDVAAGRGRHTELLARAGYRVFAVDVSVDALVSARARVSRAAPLDPLPCSWVGDLEVYPLPRQYFDLVVVARYLQRDLFPALVESLVPGGVLLYETFTEGQRALGWGPRSPEHLLAPGELRERFADLDVLFYEEVSAPESVARIVARRTRSISALH